MGGGTIFELGDTSAHKKKLENFYDWNWQLWCHKHWIMTSLTFVSMF